MINKDMLKHMKRVLRKHGGEGSGNFDHAGRPGKVGGSSKGGGKVDISRGTLSKSEDFEKASEMAIADVNSWQYGNEKIIDRKKNAYSYTNKNGKTYVFDIAKTTYDKGERGRILLIDDHENIVSGAIITKEGHLLTIYTSPFARRIGAGKRVLKAIDEYYGSVTVADTPISKVGKKLLDSYK